MNDRPGAIVLTVLPIVKAAIITVVLAAVDIAFWKALIIAGVSATVTGMFLLVATRWQINSQKRVQEELRQHTEQLATVQAKLGAGRRSTDPKPDKAAA